MNRISRRRVLAAALTAGITPSFMRLARADVGAAQIRATRRVIDVNGKAASVFGLLQTDGSHGLVAEAGKRFHVQLVNEIKEDTLVHWHGLTPPSEQDGVPELSQPALRAGGDYEYDFVLARPGTNWMHSHVGLQEQGLLAAPLIVRDPTEAGLDEQEIVILLHDFSFRDPAEIFAELRGGAGAMDHGAAAASDGDMSQTSGAGDMTGMDHGAMGSEPTMDMPHFNDVEYDALLANDRTLDDPEVVQVEAGGRVRLRIINAGASTNFWLDLGPLSGDLVAVDGHAIRPVRGNRFPLAVAQRADIRLQLPAGAGAYPVLALREGDTQRTGIVLAAPGAAIVRIPERAETLSGAVDLEFEQRLAAAKELLPAIEGLPRRRHVLELTGSMMPFDWTLNGRHFTDATPLAVRKGEWIEIQLINRTDMSHPMHLHGHPFQVIAIDDVPLNGALRDTVLVAIGSRVTIGFVADNPGHWALHCHNLYHMAAGMMTSVKYEA